MGIGIRLVDVITGLPDDPVVSEKEKASFICPDGMIVTGIDITSKNDTYTLKCTINGRRQPKKVLTEEESHWVDTGVVSAYELAVRVNRNVVDKLAGTPITRSLFD